MLVNKMEITTNHLNDMKTTVVSATDSYDIHNYCRYVKYREIIMNYYPFSHHNFYILHTHMNITVVSTIFLHRPPHIPGRA